MLFGINFNVVVDGLLTETEIDSKMMNKYQNITSLLHKWSVQ